MKKISLIVLMVLGITCVSYESKAQTTAPTSENTEVTELNTQSNVELVSNVEAKSSVSENPTIKTKTQKAQRPQRKEWEERTLVGKILLIAGTAVFVVICLLFGTVSVG